LNDNIWKKYFQKNKLLLEDNPKNNSDVLDLCKKNSKELTEGMDESDKINQIRARVLNG
jgi:hypothetical protein